MTDTASAAPTPPPARTVSILPAALVLILAVVMLFIFGFINFLDSQSTTPAALPTVVVGGLQVGPSSVFSTFPQTDDSPPANIASALIAPMGTRYLHNDVTGGGGLGGYDIKAKFVVDAPRAELLGFYKSELVALGWALFSQSTTGSGSAQLLFQKAGSDGWYWEVGAIASRTSATTTTYTYRLFQASDLS